MPSFPLSRPVIAQQSVSMQSSALHLKPARSRACFLCLPLFLSIRDGLGVAWGQSGGGLGVDRVVFCGRSQRRLGGCKGCSLAVVWGWLGGPGVAWGWYEGGLGVVCGWTGIGLLANTDGNQQTTMHATRIAKRIQHQRRERPKSTTSNGRPR